MATKFNLNGVDVTVDVPEDTPLLWVIRDELKMTGTKFGCGIGMCGACTVHVNGNAQRSCMTQVGAVEAQSITTIEGLNHPLQDAWVDAQAPQCGYCQSGQIMQAASFLEKNKNPTDEEISSAMNGNLCRCMAYKRIHSAIRKTADSTPDKGAAS